MLINFIRNKFIPNILRGCISPPLLVSIRPIMILQCQKDSYLQEFSGTVTSCTPAQNSIKKHQISGYEITLNDTILFPEGGGQPEDCGTINGIPVLKVFKRDGKTIHFTERPIPCEENVNVKVDWQRRFDHMQQHSAQHLITALAEAMFGAATTSWSLGEEISSIELDTKTFSQEQMRELEDVINEKIRQAVPVSVDYFERDDPNLAEVRTRLELPKDQNGPIRVVSIQGIDRNTCCGTHVKHLGHLQCVKLLYTEKEKKNKSNLFFVAGNRVLNYLSACVQREQSLSAILKTGPAEHKKIAEKLQKSLKQSQKNLISMSRDLAIVEGKRFKELDPCPKYFSFHKVEGDLEFMTLFLNEANNQDTLFFLSTGEKHGAGQILLSGKPEIVEQLGPRLCEMLDGKGFSKNGRYQAKVNNLSKRNQAEDLVKQYQ